MNGCQFSLFVTLSLFHCASPQSTFEIFIFYTMYFISYSFDLVCISDVVRMLSAGARNVEARAKRALNLLVENIV